MCCSSLNPPKLPSHVIKGQIHQKEGQFRSYHTGLSHGSPLNSAKKYSLSFQVFKGVLSPVFPHPPKPNASRRGWQARFVPPKLVHSLLRPYPQGPRSSGSKGRVFFFLLPVRLLWVGTTPDNSKAKMFFN